MDGFASNAGILTIATTNHPERLDPAILERPSRFDRKYTFNLPSTESRFDYLDACNERLEPSLRIGRPELEQVASLTDEFSFAYLKELVIGAMMTWIARPHEKSLADLMVAQVDSLREQMRTAPPVPLDSDGDDELHFPPSVARYMSRWRKR
jgi:ATP-dependent 26S proteasome regulatory subunit